MTIPTWIKEIEERADAAEKGPWSNYFRERVIVDSEQPWRNPNKESVEFIAHSITDVPKLIAALKIAVAALHKYQCSDCYYNRGERVCMDYGTCKAIREIEALK